MIRKAEIEDSEDLVPLVEDLVYPTSGKQMKERMKKILEKEMILRHLCGKEMKG